MNTQSKKEKLLGGTQTHTMPPLCQGLLQEKRVLLLLLNPTNDTNPSSQKLWSECLHMFLELTGDGNYKLSRLLFFPLYSDKKNAIHTHVCLFTDDDDAPAPSFFLPS